MKKEMTIKKLTTAKLKELYLSLYDSVYVVECYSVRDMMVLTAVEAELSRRGVEIYLYPKFSK